MKAGLYIWAQPSGGSVAVLRIGWARRVAGDEYEVVNQVTPLRPDYKTMFSDLAIDGPPSDWKFTRPLPRPSPLLRTDFKGPVSLDPKQWSKVCPRPKDWEE